MEISTSIAFLKCCIDNIFRIIFKLNQSGGIVLVGVVPLKTATMNGAEELSFQNNSPQGPFN